MCEQLVVRRPAPLVERGNPTTSSALASSPPRTRSMLRSDGRHLLREIAWVDHFAEASQRDLPAYGDEIPAAAAVRPGEVDRPVPVALRPVVLALQGSAGGATRSPDLDRGQHVRVAEAGHGHAGRGSRGLAHGRSTGARRDLPVRGGAGADVEDVDLHRVVERRALRAEQRAQALEDRAPSAPRCRWTGRGAVTADVQTRSSTQPSLRTPRRRAPSRTARPPPQPPRSARPARAP